MALIAMAVYVTEENRKDECLNKTLESIWNSGVIGYTGHRIILVDNNSCESAKKIMHYWSYRSHEVFRGGIEVITLADNIGTAKAINKAWVMRKPGEHCVKMDDDIVINDRGWVDEMEAAIVADPLIGQVGLKRKDCWEYPGHPEADFKSELIMLPHLPGHPWRVAEKVKHVIGSCVMHSSALLDKVGYLYQPSLYGYDDVIMSHRTHLAGFYSCFLPHVDIDHVDDGRTPYQDWKHKHSGEQTQAVIDLVHAMYRGEKSIYYNPFEI
jgi:glycosyltransferase involved in cell wall biosynthesis